MEVICSSETEVNTQRTTRRYIPEDGTLHKHFCENLKSYAGINVSLLQRSDLKIPPKRRVVSELHGVAAQKTVRTSDPSITSLTKAHHSSSSWATLIQSTFSHSVSLSIILILSFDQRVLPPNNGQWRDTICLIITKWINRVESLLEKMTVAQLLENCSNPYRNRKLTKLPVSRLRRLEQ
jgi:hypothetical protein